MNILALAIGVVVSGLVIRGFNSRRLEDSRWGYPAFLATFPVYYWVFALLGSDLGALPTEILAGLVFIVIAQVAARRRSTATLALLAVGYLGHAAYDVVHDQLVSNAGVPAWSPEFCGAVDLLLGAYVALLALRSRRMQSP